MAARELGAPMRQPHQSPPTVLAMSPAPSAVLLSASPLPPVIFLQDVSAAGRGGLEFQPTASARSVVCAAFHAPEHRRLSIPSSRSSQPLFFLLGFQDGTLATYTLYLGPSHSVHGELDADASLTSLPLQLAAFPKLHKPAMGGIAAAQFLPGYRARVASVGHDGRARLVDCEGGGRVLRTWTLGGAPATCLAIGRADAVLSLRSTASVKSGTRHSELSVLRDSFDQASVSRRPEKGAVLAIGTQSGKVLVYNLLGLLVYEAAFSEPILELEWVGDLSGAPPTPSPATSSVSITPMPSASRQPPAHSRPNEQNEPPVPIVSRRSVTEKTEESPKASVLPVPSADEPSTIPAACETTPTSATKQNPSLTTTTTPLSASQPSALSARTGQTPPSSISSSAAGTVKRTPIPVQQPASPPSLSPRTPPFLVARPNFFSPSPTRASIPSPPYVNLFVPPDLFSATPSPHSPLPSPDGPCHAVTAELQRVQQPRWA